MPKQQFDMQVDTRFGTKVLVCQDVMRSAKALQKVVTDDVYAASDPHDMKQASQDTDTWCAVI